MNHLIDYFGRFVDLSDDEIQFLVENTEVISLEKNNVILAEGQISREFYFVNSGCLRMYYISRGEEKTAYFYTENMFVSSYRSFTKQIPANHNIATIEEAELIVFSLESVQKFVSFSSTFEMLARVMMEEELAAYQEMISAFIAHSAEERYLKLVSEKPNLLQRIPQHLIATYLGVTPETLSRIRSRIHKK